MRQCDAPTTQSGRGQPHSTTLRAEAGPSNSGQGVECGWPLPLLDCALDSSGRRAQRRANGMRRFNPHEPFVFHPVGAMRLLTLIVVAVFLAGCSSSPTKRDVRSRPWYRPLLSLNADELDICEAVFRYQYHPDAVDRERRVEFFISLFGNDR